MAVAAAFMILAGLFAVAMLTEWWPIIVTQNAAHIASYHFGSESMMGHGGWKYSNPNIYAWTAFGEAIAATAALPALWMTIARRSRKAAYAVVIICAMYAGSAVVLGQIQWTTRATLSGSAAKQAVATDLVAAEPSA